MNGSEYIARILKMEGIELMPCYPSNPLIEEVAKQSTKDAHALWHGLLVQKKDVGNATRPENIWSNATLTSLDCKTAERAAYMGKLIADGLFISIPNRGRIESACLPNSRCAHPLSSLPGYDKVDKEESFPKKY